MKSEDFIKKIVIVTSIAATILIIGLTSYFLNFHSGFASESNSWADFAVYIGLFMGISNLIFLGFISYSTLRITHTFNELQFQPILSITNSTPTFFAGKFPDSLYITNASKATALNVIVRFKMNRSGNFSKWVSCYSLADGQSQELPWMHYPDVIQVCFTDTLNWNSYLLEMKDLSTSVSKISTTEFNDYQTDAKENKFNNSISLRDQFKRFIETEFSRTHNMDTVMAGYNGFIIPIIF